MFGHIERPVNWARHLLRLRELQSRTGGSELVPLLFVHMEAPIYLKGAARKGPTWREALLMHAVSRIALHPHFTNVQASWVKLGADGIAACLDAGCNDVGGTLMNETITRSAGAAHGQEMPPEQMEDVIAAAGPFAAPAYHPLWRRTRGASRPLVRSPAGHADRRDTAQKKRQKSGT